jgi:hypothetical protein
MTSVDYWITAAGAAALEKRWKLSSCALALPNTANSSKLATTNVATRISKTGSKRLMRE